MYFKNYFDPKTRVRFHNHNFVVSKKSVQWILSALEAKRKCDPTFSEYAKCAKYESCNFNDGENKYYIYDDMPERGLPSINIRIESDSINDEIEIKYSGPDDIDNFINDLRKIIE